MEEKKIKRIGAYKVLSDATLKRWKKEDLIEQIRILEHNWAATEEALNNSAKNGEKIIFEQKAKIERLEKQLDDKCDRCIERDKRDGAKELAEKVKGELKDGAYYSKDIVTSIMDQLLEKITEGKA